MGVREWIFAAEGFAEFHGGGAPDVPTLDEIAEAEARYEEMMRRRDG